MFHALSNGVNMLTIFILALFALTLCALCAARLIGRACQAIAFDVASYATTPAPSASAALDHYMNRVCFRAVRCALALADTITARALRATSNERA